MEKKKSPEVLSFNVHIMAFPTQAKHHLLFSIYFVVVIIAAKS